MIFKIRIPTSNLGSLDPYGSRKYNGRQWDGFYVYKAYKVYPQTYMIPPAINLISLPTSPSLFVLF